MRFHRDGSLPVNTETILVFGSNLRGRHGAGAALEAARRFGAVEGQYYGLFGRSFAIPTKDRSLKTMPVEGAEGIRDYVGRFVVFASSQPGMRFFVTRVGCVRAGIADEVMAGLFLAKAKEIGFDLRNCSFAEEWRPFLEGMSAAA